MQVDTRCLQWFHPVLYGMVHIRSFYTIQSFEDFELLMSYTEIVFCVERGLL